MLHARNKRVRTQVHAMNARLRMRVQRFKFLRFASYPRASNAYQRVQSQRARVCVKFRKRLRTQAHATKVRDVIRASNLSKAIVASAPTVRLRTQSHAMRVRDIIRAPSLKRLRVSPHPRAVMILQILKRNLYCCISVRSQQKLKNVSARNACP